MLDESKWYVVHTYSSYENKVKANIEKAIKNRNMEDLIHEIRVPMQDETEEKKWQTQDGATQSVSRVCVD